MSSFLAFDGDVYAQQQGVPSVADMTIQIDEYSDLTFVPLDKDGTPTANCPEPTWSVSDPSVLQLEPVPNNSSAFVRRMIPLGPLAPNGVTVTAEAAAPNGGTPIVSTLVVDVTPGAATSGKITFTIPAFKVA